MELVLQKGFGISTLRYLRSTEGGPEQTIQQPKNLQIITFWSVTLKEASSLMLSKLVGLMIVPRVSKNQSIYPCF